MLVVRCCCFFCDRCSLFVRCCLLFVVFCALRVVRCVICVVCFVDFVGRCFVFWCLAFGGSSLMCGVRGMLVVCCLLLL